MEVLVSRKANGYAIVFRSLTKWPFVFTTPDQKGIRFAELLAEEIVPSWMPLDTSVGPRYQSVGQCCSRCVSTIGLK